MIALAVLEDIIDASGAAPRIEAMLPIGVRPRQLTVRALLAGMCLTQADHRPAHLTRVHQALTSLPGGDQARLGVVADWKDGPHLLTYRQTERTFGLVADALAKDEPDGLPPQSLAGICDALLEASIPDEFKDASTSLAVDWTDLETFSRPPPAKGGDCADPEASWVFAAAQDVHDGDTQDWDAGAWRAPPGGVPGGAVVDGVAAWWSVCRGGLLADGGAGGGFVDDVLAGCVGGQERGDREPVDGAGKAAGLGVHGADGVVGEQGVGPAG